MFLCSFTSWPTKTEANRSEESMEVLKKFPLFFSLIFGKSKASLGQKNCLDILSVRSRVLQSDYITRMHFPLQGPALCSSLLWRMTVQSRQMRQPFEVMCSIQWVYKYNPGHAPERSEPAGKAQLQQCVWSDGVMQFMKNKLCLQVWQKGWLGGSYTATLLTV